MRLPQGRGSPGVGWRGGGGVGFPWRVPKFGGGWLSFLGFLGREGRKKGSWDNLQGSAPKKEGQPRLFEGCVFNST